MLEKTKRKYLSYTEIFSKWNKCYIYHKKTIRMQKQESLSLRRACYGHYKLHCGIQIDNFLHECANFGKGFLK